MNERAPQQIPPGYITRARAQDLTAMFKAGITQILHRWGDRSVDQIEGLIGAEKTEAKVHALLTAEKHVAMVELDALQALMLERLNAGEDH